MHRHLYAAVMVVVAMSGVLAQAQTRQAPKDAQPDVAARNRAVPSVLCDGRISKSTPAARLVVGCTNSTRASNHIASRLAASA